MTRIASIDLPTGVRLEYAEQGDPEGVPVLLLHGYTDSRRSFDRLLPHLPPGLRAIAPSQRGHGDSGRPPRDYSPGHFAADAIALMDGLGIDRAVVAGHSGGGYAAQRLAIDEPERVLGLVLLNAFRSTADSPAAGDLWEEVRALTDPVPAAFAREFQLSTLVRPVPPEFLATVVGESTKVPARVWREYLRELLRAPAPTETGPVVVPTLIVHGDRDEIVPLDSARRLAGEIADAELVVYPGTGHDPHWEEPERVAADLVAFALRAAARMPVATA